MFLSILKIAIRSADWGTIAARAARVKHIYVRCARTGVYGIDSRQPARESSWSAPNSDVSVSSVEFVERDESAKPQLASAGVSVDTGEQHREVGGLAQRGHGGGQRPYVRDRDRHV